MNICLLFSIFPEQLHDEIRDNTKVIFQEAASVLQKNILEGLTFNHSSIYVINAPLLGYYHVNYRRLHSPSLEYTRSLNGADIHINSFRFNTFPGFLGYTRKRGALNLLERWIKGKESEQNVIILYSVHKPFMEACYKFKHKHPSVRLVLIVPDLPELMYVGRSLLTRLHKKYVRMQRPRFKKLYGIFDGFVFLTEAMNSVVNKRNKSYTVIEGIASSVAVDSLEEMKLPAEKYILYSGSLMEKYGVLNLVRAFLKIQNKEYKLVLCGFGDAVADIKKYQAENPSIIFVGQLPTNAVRFLQRKAFLLVNPRQNIGEYTGYSFPSKIMEYFISGRPSLIYKLDGIPCEYYNYCFTLVNNSIDALTEKLDEILNIPSDSLSDMGIRARDFILTHKNSKIQCEKISNLIRLITMENCDL